MFSTKMTNWYDYCVATIVIMTYLQHLLIKFNDIAENINYFSNIYSNVLKGPGSKNFLLLTGIQGGIYADTGISNTCSKLIVMS